MEPASNANVLSWIVQPGPVEKTHHKLEAEGKGGVVLGSGTVVPDLIIGHFRYLFS